MSEEKRRHGTSVTPRAVRDVVEIRRRIAALEAELERERLALDDAFDHDVSRIGPARVALVVDETQAGEARRMERANASRRALDGERLAYVVEAMSDGLVIVGTDGRIVFVNGRYAGMLGYKRDALVGRAATELVRDETHLEHASGALVTVVSRSAPLLGPSGAPEGTISIVTDVTTSKHLAEIKSRLEALVEGSDDAVMTFDVFGVISSWNRAASDLYGFAQHEMIGRSMDALMGERGASELRAILEQIALGHGVRHHEAEHLREDGTPVRVLLTVTPMRDEEGRIFGASAIARDLSERTHATSRLRATEAQLRQSQKMDAIGRLASGIAHDFNNLLCVVMSSTGFLLADVPDDSVFRVDIEEIAAAAERASELTKQLLAFSRQQVLAPQVLDLNAVVGDVERMLARTLGEHVELSLELAPRLGRVFADRGQMEQVLLNLTVNARDAMPGGGVVLVETRNVHVSTETRSVSGTMPRGEYVALSVTDTGCGMDEDVSRHVFEPFFSTKAPGLGTGLGLATVFGIVTQSQGYLTLASEPDVGTCVTMLLPRSDQRTATTSAPPPPVATLRGTETALLVEDDDRLRRVMCTSLKRQGYRVLEARNGGEAMMIAEAHTGRIDLLLTDVVMPHITGVALAARLCPARPDMRVLYVSGHIGDAVELVHADAASRFLQKPFTPEALALKVREVLEEPR